MIKENKDLQEIHGREYWKSLDDLADTPGFRNWLDREFPEGASLIDGVQRRGFLKIMAASFGLAGLGMTGCRRPEHAILPHGKSPEELIPGVPAFYSTSRPTSTGFVPLIVESHEGRPTKIEGNPSYKEGGGSTDIYSQASILDLYDPDRARGCFQKDSVSSGDLTSTRWKKLSSNEILEKFNSIEAKEKIAIVSSTSFSSARKHLLSNLCKSGVCYFEYEAIDLSKPEKFLGEALGIKESLRAIPKLENAKRVLSLDSDFLGYREPNSSFNTKQFMKGRKVYKADDAKKMNRLYSVESDLTLAGGFADHRLRVSSSEILPFASMVLLNLLKAKKYENQRLIDHLEKLSSNMQEHKEWVSVCVKDLLKNSKNSVVLAGSHLPQSVHLITHKINELLENRGTCIEYILIDTFSSEFSEFLKGLTNEKFETIIFLGCNPVYHFPSVDWESLLKPVKSKYRLGLSIDETSHLCDFHIGQSHYLECWDVGKNWNQDYFFPVQPLIAPLFDTLSDLEILSSLLGEFKNPYEISKDYISGIEDFEHDFENFLKHGIAKAIRNTYAKKSNSDEKILQIKFKNKNLSPDSLEVLLTPDFHTWDGQFSNNGWMMECPQPTTKLTWDNAILISPVLADKLEKKFPDLELLPKSTLLNKTGQVAPDNAVFQDGRQKAPIVKIIVGDHHEVLGPLYVQPGLADYSVVTTIGQGRSRVGRVGTGNGFNMCSLLHIDSKRIITGAHILPTGDYYNLANVQEHWSMEGRAIVRETNAKYYSEHEDFAQHMGAESHSPPVWGKDQDASVAEKATTTPRGYSAHDHPDHTYEHSETFGLHQWGMSIDLNQCTGCSACVVACQSENNIPIVGKDQVLRGREMHWIRMDRYYSSSKRNGDEIPSDVQVSYQGVSCMHCETAPCEQVCPVNATVHDEEGLNAMAYNRCVGTRYCANNCPYKVRRFNFFDWNKRQTDELYKGPLGEKNDSLPDMGKNPDVTIRMRGVMEKCTYCVQRIQEAKIKTKVQAQQKAKFETGKDGSEMILKTEDIKVPDGTIRTACQQACPADSVVFGDLSDPNSAVSKLKSNPRNYSVLGYLNTRPRTTYLAKIRNPNPYMPDYEKKPHSYREYSDKAYPSSNGKSKSSEKDH